MKTTLISSLIASSMALTPMNTTDAVTKSEGIASERSLVQIPFSTEYITNLYKDLDPVGASFKYVQDYEEIQKAREEYSKQREIELAKKRAEEERKAEEAKLELARRESVTFDAYDITQKSYVTEHELRQVLALTNGGDGLINYSSYFVEAEETYGINAFLMTALAAQESGWGKKAAGNGTNLTGYAVYTRHHTGKTFSGGVRENILATAKLLAEEYVNPEGRYYTKWDNYSGRSVYEINQRYCLLQDQKTVDNRWSKALAKIGNDLNNTYHNSVKSIKLG